MSITATSGLPISFDFASSDDVATVGESDYSGISGRATINAGSLSISLFVVTAQDALDEYDETLFVDLANPTNGLLLDSHGVGTITDDDGTPNLFVSDATATEGGSLVFTVSLDAVSGRDVSFDRVSTDGSGFGGAVSPSDFAALVLANLTIAKGSTSVVVQVASVDDVLFEPSEVMTLDVSNVVNATAVDAQGLGTLNDNDSQPKLYIGDATVTEGVTAAFLITLDAVSGVDVVFGVASNDGVNGNPALNALQPADYTQVILSNITIPAGSLSYTVNVSTNDDAINESSEGYSVDVTLGSGALVGDLSGAGTITDNDAAPQIYISDAAAVTEGAVAYFTVSLNSITGLDVTFNYETLDDTATSAQDYSQVVSTTGTIPAGQLTFLVPVTTTDDVVDEVAAEYFHVSLTAPVNAAIADNSGDGTINDNDAPPQIFIVDQTITEGGVAVFAVSISSISDLAVGFDYQTIDGSGLSGAVSPSDFTAAAPTAGNIPAGSLTTSISIASAQDLIDEVDETFNVSLSNLANVTAGDDLSVGTIQDDDPTPTLFISSATITESQTAELTISLSNPSSQDVTFDVASLDNTALSASDYSSLATTSMTIPAGSLSVAVSVESTDDLIQEPVETFAVVLSNGVNATVQANPNDRGIVTINDNDLAAEIFVSDAVVSEGETLGFLVTLSKPSGLDVTFNYQTFNGTALVADSDYTAASGVATIPVGQISLVLNVVTTEDTKYETNEDLLISLSSVANATVTAVGTDDVASGTMNNDDPVPGLYISDDSVVEGGTLAFTVSLDAVSGVDVTVQWSTADNTALVADSDYTPVGATLITIAAGSLSTTVNVVTTDDLLFESAETLNVDLASATGANIVDAQGAGTITNDDGQPNVFISDLTVLEGDTASFGISLSALSGLPVVLTYQTYDGAMALATAVAGSDYTNVAATVVTIAAYTSSINVDVATIEDLLNEGNEGFSVSLSAISGAGVGDDLAGATITDDDGPPLLYVVDAPNVTEGAQSQFVVSLVSASGLDVTFDYQTLDDTALSAQDYAAQVLRGGTIPAGQLAITIAVNTTDDLVDEVPTEFYTLTLSSLTNAAAGDLVGQGAIDDNDSAPLIFITDSSATEGGVLTFAVSISTLSDLNVGFSWATVDGTGLSGATSPADFSAVTVTAAQITAGSLTLAVQVTSAQDTIDEVAETFGVTLSGLSNVSVGDDLAVGTINDDDSSPTLYISGATITEGDTASLNVSLDHASSQDVTFEWVTADNTALSAGDYSAVATSLVTIPAGSLSLALAVVSTEDAIQEPAEDFNVLLSNASNATLQANPNDRAVVTINDDDGAPQLFISDATITEGGTLIFGVSLSSVSGLDVTFNFVSNDGTATTGDSDYSSVSGTATISAGNVTVFIEVASTQDTKYENSETLNVTLSSLVNALVGDTGAVGTITNDDAQPNIKIYPVALNEGSVLPFTVSLSAISGLDVTFTYSTFDVSATTADSDYTQQTNVALTIAAGSLTVIAPVASTADTKFEANETFTTSLSSIVNATVATPGTDDVATGTINNDDAQPTLFVSDLSGGVEDVAITEGETATIWVSLSSLSGVDVVFDFATQDNTAAQPADYATATGTVTIPQGALSASFNVASTEDAIQEAAEDFRALLSNASNATLQVNPNDRAVIAINDDDGAPQLFISDATSIEGGTLIHGVSLSSVSGLDVTFNFASNDGTATTADSDYSAVSGVATIPAGNLTLFIEVATTQDAKYENSETLNVTLSSLVNALVGDTGAVGTITNDDGQPSIKIYPVAVNEGSVLPFTVSLSAISGLDVTFNFSTFDGTATTADSDYTQQTNVAVTISAGSLTVLAPVASTSDTKFETNETFTASLSTIVNATVAIAGTDDVATGTINNEDTQPTIFVSDLSVGVEDLAINEGETATIWVSLSSLSGVDVVFDYATQDNTASQPADYATASGTVTILHGALSVSFNVVSTEDLIHEAAESFSVTLTSLIGATSGDSYGLIAINDDDLAPDLFIADAAIGEGDTLVFGVSLSSVSALDVTFNVASSDASAKTSDSDYVAVTTSATIPAGSLTLAIEIATIQDSKYETNETLNVTLTALVGAQVGDTGAVGTILNDDVVPNIFVSDAAVAEGGTLAFAISLDAISGVDATVNWSTADNSATVADSDYTSVASTLVTIPAGSLSVSGPVSTLQDVLYEANETLYVNLASATAATIVDPQGVGTINNDDTQPNIFISDLTLLEGDSGSFAVSLSAISGLPVVFSYQTYDGAPLLASASNAVDYTAVALTTVTIAAYSSSASLDVNTIEDLINEGDEGFSVSLSALSGAGIGDDLAKGTITDDDAAPLLFVNDSADVIEGNVSEFVVSLSAISGLPVTFHFQTYDDTAVSSQDYTAHASTAATIVPGQLALTVSVNTIDDARDEVSTEYFLLSLSSAVNAAAGNLLASGGLDDNDSPPQIFLTSATATEGSTLQFAASLSAVSDLNVTFNYSTLDGTATTVDSDYTSELNHAMTIVAGSLSVSAPVATTADTRFENSETLTASLTAVVFATVSAPADVVATGTIANDDIQPNIELTNATVTEGTTAIFWATLSAPSGLEVTFTFSTLDGTALQPGDYTLIANPQTISAGALSIALQVVSVQDASPEVPENFKVSLSAIAGASWSGNLGTITIVDDDILPYTWTGLGPDTNWTTASNWSTATVPGAAQTAIFNAACISCAVDIDATITIAGAKLEAAFTGAITQGSGKVINIGANGWLQAAGSFVGSNANIVSTGALSVSGGTFASTSGELLLYANAELNAGFQHQNGSIRLAQGYACGGGCMLSYYQTVQLNAPITVWNLIIDNDDVSADAGYNEFGSRLNGSSVQIDHDLTFRNGTLYGTSAITLVGNLTGECAGGDYYSTASCAGGGDVVLKLAGTGAQTISGQAGSAFPGVEINNPAGVTISGSPLTFRNISVQNGTLTASPSGTINFARWVGITFGSFLEGLQVGASGAFIQDNTTLAFLGGRSSSSNEPIQGFDVNGGLTIAGLYVKTDNATPNQWAPVQVGTGDRIVVTGDISIVSGGFTGAATIAAQKNLDFECANSATQDCAQFGSTSLELTGAAYQTVSMAAGSQIFAPSVVVNKSAGVVSQVSPVFLDAASQDLSINSGYWKMNGNALTVSNGSGVDNELTIGATSTLETNCGTLAYETLVNSGTLLDGVATPNIAISDATATEGGTLAFVASLDALRCAGNVTMNYQSFDGTATTANSDYTAASGVATFTPGMLALTIPVVTTQDATAEGNETLTLSLSAAANGTITDSIAIGTIVNDDMAAFTWTGLGGNSDWTTAANWSTTVVPGASDTAIFNNMCTQCNATINAAINVSGIRLDSGYAGLVSQGAAIPFALGSAGWNQNGGAFSGSTGAITIVGNFIQSAGAFTATSGTLFIVSPTYASQTLLTMSSSASFAHNSGTVSIFGGGNGSCQNYYYNLDVASGINFNNLILDGNYANSSCNWPIMNTATGSILNVLSLFAHKQTVFNGYVDLKGSLSVANNDRAGGVGTITLSGSSAQVYGGTGQTVNLVINNSGGGVGPSGVAPDFSVANLKILAGTFTAPTGILSIRNDQATSQTIMSVATSGASFVHNSGTVQFFGWSDPNCTAPTYTIDVPNTTQFYNVVFDGTYDGGGGCNHPNITSAAGKKIIATNNLVHKQVNFNGDVDLFGNISVANGLGAGGSGTIRLSSASGGQTYTGTGMTVNFNVDNLAGSVVPAAGTTDFTLRRLTLTNGTFVAPTGILTVQPTNETSQTIMSAAVGTTFTPNNGVIRFKAYSTPSCTSSVSTVDVPNGMNFYDVILDGNWATSSCTEALLTTAVGKKIVATHDLTYGQMSFSGVAEVQSNFTVANSDGAGGSGTISFNHPSNDQTLTVASGAGVCNLVVNKTAGNVNLAGPTALSVAGTDLTIQSGTLKMNGYSLTVADYLTIDAGATLATGCGAYTPSTLPKFVNNGTLDNGASSPNITIGDASITEGGTLAFVASLDAVRCAGNVTMNYQSFDGTATTANSDYTAASGVATFTPGMLALTIPVVTTQDATAEGNETLTLSLSAAANGTITDNIAIGTIVNDDMAAFTWTGLGGNSDWTTAANWSTTVVPGAGDTAYFSNMCTQCTAIVNANVNPQGIYMYSGYAGQISISGSSILGVGSSGWVMNGGTFNGGSGTVSLSGGALSVVGGMFNGPSGDLVIVRNIGSGKELMFVDPSSSTNLSLSTFKFAGTANWSSTSPASLNVPNGTTFGSVDFRLEPANQFNIYLYALNGVTIGVANSLAVGTGTSNDQGAELKGFWDVKGDLTIGKESLGGQLNSGTVILSGTGTQTINAYAGRRGAKLQVNKVSGSVVMGGGVTDLKLSGLDVANGTFDAPTGILSVGRTEYNTEPTLFKVASGATFNDNGTVRFDGVSLWGNTSEFTVDVPDLYSFKRIETTHFTSANGYTVVVKPVSGRTIVVSESLRHGIDSFTGGDGHARLKGTWKLLGDLYVGTEAESTYPGAGEIIMAGTGVQKYAGPSSKGTVMLTVNKPSGSVVPDSGVTTLAVNRFKLVSGSFTAPSGTMQIAPYGNATLTLFQVDAGTTFNVNAGTVLMRPYGEWGTDLNYYITVPAAFTFANIAFRELDSGDDNSGGRNFDPGAVTIGVSGNLLVGQGDGPFGALLKLRGNWEIGGNVTFNAEAGGGPAAFKFTGAANQTLSIASGVDVPDGLWTIDKSGGAVNLASYLPLNFASQDLTVQSGTLNMGSYALTVSNGSGVDNVLTIGSGSSLFTGCGSLTYETLVNNGSLITGSNVLLSAYDMSVTEGDGSVLIPISLSGPSCASTVFNYATVSGTAGAPGDYTAKSGTATIAAGASAITISVAIADDAVAESSETFTLSLSSVTGSGVLDPLAVISIADNETAPALFIDTASVSEGDTAALEVSISGLSSQNIVFTWSTVTGTATGSDFTAVSGALGTIPAGQLTTSIFVVSTEDMSTEANEILQVSIISATNASGTPGAALTILDDDTGALAILPSTLNIQRNGRWQFSSAGGSAPYSYSLASGAGTVTSVGRYSNAGSYTDSIELTDATTSAFSTVSEYTPPAESTITLASGSSSNVARDYAAGHFVDSGGPSSGYQDDEYAYSIISISGATSYKLHFNHFDTEEGCDYVYIYDGDWNYITEFSGATIPGDITIAASQFILEWESDGSVTETGFEIEWAADGALPLSIGALEHWVPIGDGTPVMATGGVGPYAISIVSGGGSLTAVDGQVSMFDGGATMTVATVQVTDADGSVASVVITASGYAGFATATSSVGEDAGAVSIPVVSDPASAFAITLSYTISGTATGSDHDLVAGSIEIPGGQTIAYIPFTITDDTTPEKAETIVVSLASADGAMLAEPQVHTATIRQSDWVQDFYPDPSFNSVGFRSFHGDAGGQDDFAYGVTIDGNGKILMTGMLMSWGTARDMALWRLNSDGTGDTTFNGTGLKLYNFWNWDWGFDVIIDSGNKPVVSGYVDNCGDDPNIWRFTNAGAFDTTFDSDGMNRWDFGCGTEVQGRGMARTSDGGFVIIASQYENYISLVKFTSSGAVDATFGTGGRVNFNTFTSYAGKVAVDSTGKILVFGRMKPSGSDWDMAVWRFTSGGVLDTTFNSVGYITHGGAAGGTSATDLGSDGVIDGSNNIYVTGSSSNGANSDMVIWKITNTGTLDTSFNGTGFVVAPAAWGVAGNEAGKAIRSDASGKLVIAGTSVNAEGNADMTLWRYSTSGSIDTTFSTLGYITHDGAAGGFQNDTAENLVIDSQGRIIVVGESAATSTGDLDATIWVFSRPHSMAGTLDTAFSGDGVFAFGAGSNQYDSGFGLDFDSNNKPVVSGINTNSGNLDGLVMRLDPATGSLDTTLNGTGYLSVNQLGWDMWQGGVRALANGQFIVGATLDDGSTDDPVVINVKPDGTLDGTWGASGGYGRVTVGGGEEASEQMIYDASSDEYLVCGHNWSSSNFYVARFTSSGAPQFSFGSDGAVVRNDISNSSAQSVVVEGSVGYVYATGYGVPTASEDMILYKFTPSGGLDATFGAGAGYVTHGGAAGGGGGTDRGYFVAMAPDGAVVVIGSSVNLAGNSDLTIWKYLKDGTLDYGFNGTGFKVIAGPASGDDAGLGGVFDGKYLYVTGYVTNSSGNKDMAVWKLDWTSASLDSGFGSSGLLSHDGASGTTGYNDLGRRIRFAPDGRLYIVGESGKSPTNTEVGVWVIH